MKPIILSVDLEDGHGEYAPQGRYIAMTEKWLRLCEENNRKATFFTIGRIAEAAPDLIKKIAREGHEIAYHSHNHIAFTQENPERFRRETREDKDKLEQLIGKPVIGFRAPRFSLQPKTLWALDILKEEGFVYSSSIMPTPISLFRFKGAPRTPFKWENGLIEFPLPVALRIFPYLGGIYLYLFPFPIVRFFAYLARNQEGLWTHGHPYDLDREEKFRCLPGTPLWVSAILYGARFLAEGQIKRVMKLGAGGTFAERINEKGFGETLPFFTSPS